MRHAGRCELVLGQHLVNVTKLPPPSSAAISFILYPLPGWTTRLPAAGQLKRSGRNHGRRRVRARGDEAEGKSRRRSPGPAGDRGGRRPLPPPQIHSAFEIHTGDEWSSCANMSEQELRDEIKRLRQARARRLAQPLFRSIRRRVPRSSRSRASTRSTTTSASAATASTSATTRRRSSPRPTPSRSSSARP